MFKIAICEDNSADLMNLHVGIEQWLLREQKVNGDVEEYTIADELLTAMDEKQFDVYLLDVLMPGCNGIELGRQIRSRNKEVPIIYITSSEEYALCAYGLHAIRYISKPLNEEELFSALDMAYELYLSKPRHHLLLNGPDSVSSIIIEDIMYIENSQRNIVYTMSDGHSVTVNRRKGSFEEAVGSLTQNPIFVQTHKSYFVNMCYVKSIKNDTVLMDDGSCIPIARRRLAEMKDRYINYCLR